jgi:hypothetical protein
MSPAGLGNKNDYTGEDYQQLTRQTDRNAVMLVLQMGGFMKYAVEMGSGAMIYID